MTFELPPLPYGYDALEPYIDAQTMQIHHDKHHQAYTDKLNAALEKYPDLQAKPIEELLKDLDSVPEEIRPAVRNHGGGYYNHSLFWEMMKKGGGGEAAGELKTKLDQDFGSFEEFKKQFSEVAATAFGSGWAWLVKDPAGKLAIVKTPNQDSPISQGQFPLLGIDVWEHAYYLKYQNRRPEYIENWWNVVNWEQVEALFLGPSAPSHR
ncbi:superoxide dismutase [candidate division WWE3 bacterium RIFCSPLOWO2_02_FULL_53_10]|uniref:Superoxide dismutase n=2 Tax=Katanobacteria TaxID=422282 RepID=A0A1F4WC45_UNCKA|nr:MAG: superoxide dismutase [candidate division WWE3 bacterium RIFCSPLOWO2_01_FULL_53_14]OGC66982.1 MAG: superoxide dismutase [candidate division WWE3 bacterium RIFCSPLOWO2_02_FULL_53_10]